ncbi:MAG TPA: ChaN family lipoprotein, partial [Rhodocyclaceae bacterium]
KTGAPPATSACLSAAAWSRLDGARPRPASIGWVLGDMAAKDVVLLGEQHDVADDHRWQVQTLAVLHAQRPQMAIGFEMFPRRLQPVLDRWVAGELTARQFIEQSGWDSVWGLPAELYLPIFEFARMNRIPMLALDIDGKLSKAIAEKGWDAVAAAEREGVSRPAPPSAAYRDFLQEIYRQHPALDSGHGAKAEADAHGDKSAAERGFVRFVESQTARDRAMAEAIAGRAGRAGAGPLIVGIMGNGHLRFGWGVPHQLRDLGVKKVGILMPMSVETDCASIGTGMADAVFALPKQAEAPPEPPRLGVRLDSDKGAVSVAEVTPGSLAEKTGLKAGDRLLRVADQPVNKVTQVIAAVRRQPGGTWLPIQVRRGDATVDLVAKFPAVP